MVKGRNVHHVPVEHQVLCGKITLDSDRFLQQLIGKVGSHCLLAGHPGFRRHHAGNLPVGKPCAFCIACHNTPFHCVQLVCGLPHLRSSEKPHLDTGGVVNHHVSVPGNTHRATSQRHIDGSRSAQPIHLAGDALSLPPSVFQCLGNGHTFGGVAPAGVDMHHNLLGGHDCQLVDNLLGGNLRPSFSRFPVNGLLVGNVVIQVQVGDFFTLLYPVQDPTSVLQWESLLPLLLAARFRVLTVWRSA